MKLIFQLENRPCELALGDLHSEVNKNLKGFPGSALLLLKIL